MARKRYTAEEIIGHLRGAEVALAQGQPVGAVVRTLGISEPTDDRGRREYGGLRVDQATRLKGLERENSACGSSGWWPTRRWTTRCCGTSQRETSAPGPAAPGDVLPHQPVPRVGATGLPSHRPGAGTAARRAPAVDG